MILVAALAWYAETPETLERCARSLGGVCDMLVALGGRWDNFPPLPGDDVHAQKSALRAGADQAGILCDVAYGDQPFESQVEKRAELMAAARGSADWVFVIDADEYVADVNQDELVKALDETLADAASVHGIRVPHKLQAKRPWRRIYRASTGVTVSIAHNGYQAADGRWLYGDPAHVTLEPALDVTKHLLLVHDLEARGPDRLAARKAYQDARRAEGLETWPEPVLA